ncbi:MAG TPA: DUF58 domain-containing protein [Candidatus Acidoferrum sp.]|nr:DUF58 domain-containing protein [Candidatus Acidoferrum sp.]
MSQQNSLLTQLWAKTDTPGVRAFFLSIVALGVALLLAVYSGAAAELGNIGLAASSALLALAIAGWVAVTMVPTLAKRTPLRWIGYRMEYRISTAGWIYIAATLLVALAALNTGNNLLFLILACLISVILMSGILSSISLAGVELRVELPEHIFAGQTLRATVELHNEKLLLPSFGLRVEAAVAKGAPAAAVLETPVFFPYLPRQERVKQSVPVAFLRRGLHVQDTFRIVTRFPFGFLQKTRRLTLKSEALVYPQIDTSSELADMFPGIEGSLESHSKGRGHDLHALREYLPTDSARHVHWKASARMGSLMVREFAREDDRRVLLVLDPYSGSVENNTKAGAEERFERAVNLCAGIAWHFYERAAQLEFRGAGIETRLAPAEENIFAILRYLAVAEPEKPGAESPLLEELAASPELFKLIVTSRQRGTIPSDLWHSSYVVFLESLEESRSRS